jgi:hypothetical protein
LAQARRQFFVVAAAAKIGKIILGKTIEIILPVNPVGDLGGGTK